MWACSNGAAGLSFPWVLGFAETLAGVSLFQAPRGGFTLSPMLDRVSFAVLCPAWGAGFCEVRLRFGFEDVNLGPQGINFPGLTGAGISFFRSPAFADAAIAPGAPGSAPAFIPPRVRVQLTTQIGTTLDYAVYYSGAGLT